MSLLPSSLLPLAALSALALSSAAIADESVTVDAALPGTPDIRPIFDAFRAGMGPPLGRLDQIHSDLVRMFAPLTYYPWLNTYQLDVVKGSWPDLTYQFASVDLLVYEIVGQGSQVNLGYCYMPKALGDDPWGPPNNYDAWQEFNYEWALHFHDRFGVEYFEIWNEPDYDEFFSGSRDDYFTMYDYAVRGIRAAVPDARVGGPALANNVGWAEPFLDYVQLHALPLDFFSYHSQDNGYNDTRYRERYDVIVAALEGHGMDAVGVHLNEFSYELSPHTGSSYDRSQCAAWYAGTFKNMLLTMPRLTRFNKTIIDNGPGDGEWENNGLLDWGDVPKAKFNLFRMMAEMPLAGVDCDVSAGVDAMASRSADRVTLLLWNRSGDPREVDVEIRNVDIEHFLGEVFLIDPEHSSYYDNPESDELERIDRFFGDSDLYSEHFSLREYSVLQVVLKKGLSRRMEVPLPPD
jgi:hypothetical protein